MCGLRQLVFFHCGPETPKVWKPLASVCGTYCIAFLFPGLSPPSVEVAKCEWPGRIGQNVTKFHSVIILVGDMYVNRPTWTRLSAECWSRRLVRWASRFFSTWGTRYNYVCSWFGQLHVQGGCRQLCWLCKWDTVRVKTDLNVTGNWTSVQQSQYLSSG